MTTEVGFCGAVANKGVAQCGQNTCALLLPLSATLT
jgi:hypothetical protein